MGYAQGQLLSDIAPALADSIWAYFQSQVDSLIPNFPKWLQNLVADFGKLGFFYNHSFSSRTRRRIRYHLLCHH